MECSICGAHMAVEAMVCDNCGAPADYRAASGAQTNCALCGEVLWSLAETCVHCHGRGYPALRPRMGDRSVGAPEKQIGV